MFRIYAIVIVVGLVGGAVWGAYGYYKDTQPVSYTHLRAHET